MESIAEGDTAILLCPAKKPILTIENDRFPLFTLRSNESSLGQSGYRYRCRLWKAVIALRETKGRAQA